ncbi:DUF2290 domain-containing protein [Mycolicibacterium goodii]|uniref:DUF2290 domain-containing protein n=1 Tax=Mycolicibacterium goodii TaxID=134601 RepID=UPI001F034B9D|nr:DUF2290 domain-containing protein [Mycolicibacterium goodii]ULN49108.1 DUF2290 domain-containing protein [Mycolicibacterium goodii]
MAKTRVARAAIAGRIQQELSDLITDLIGLGMVDHQNYSAITMGADDSWQVAQPGAQLHLSLKSRPYEDIYLELIGAGCYNLLFLDGAIVQLSYDGIGERVVRHRLAYLPSPSLRPYQDDPELYLLEKHFVEIVGHQVVPVPVRFDFDDRAGVSRDVIHPVSHVTLGQYQHCRIPVTAPVSPRCFVEFILNSFYSTPESARISLRSHVEPWATTITPRERSVVHVNLGEPTGR